jgi:hypothetical protein
MGRLSYEEILAALQPSWYVDTFPTDANTPWPTANLYWTDTAGNTDYYVSTGIVTGGRDNTVRRLRETAAQYLVVGQCVGGITNVRPRSFQVIPIYFR